MRKIEQKLMKLFVIKTLGVATLAAILIASCAKDDREPTAGLSPEREPVAEISFEADVDEDDIEYREEGEGEFRALDFTASGNKKGKRHPHLSLALSAGKRIPMSLIFKNKVSGKSFVHENATFVYKVDPKSKKGRLRIEGLELENITDTELKRNSDQWHLMVALGGTWDDRKLRFAPTTAMPLTNTGAVSLEQIYLSQSWLPLTLKEKDVQVGNKKQKKLFLSPQSSTPLRLKSQCMTLMFSLQANNTPDPVDFYGVGLSTSDLSFAGEYDFSEGALNVTTIPTYQPDARSYTANFMASSAERMPASGGPSKYIYCVGIPKTATTTTSHIRFYPYVSARLEFSRYADKQNVPIRSGAFLGVNNILVTRPELDHPIEAVLTRDGEAIYENNTGTLNDALNSGGTYSENGAFRSYSLPNIYQMAVLVPTLEDTKSILPKDWQAILDFGRRKSYTSITEKIATWATDYSEYTADYQPGADGIYYATRLRDGTDSGGPYYSAYRYERKGNTLEIRVRELKNETVTTPRPPIRKWIPPTRRPKKPGRWIEIPQSPLTVPVNITHIANEAYWNAPAKWNVREYKRTISQGVYWSTTRTRRVTMVNHSLKIFTNYSDDQRLARPDAAFVGREDYESFADNPNLPKNRRNKKSILMTTQRTN